MEFLLQFLLRVRCEVWKNPAYKQAFRFGTIDPTLTQTGNLIVSRTDSFVGISAGDRTIKAGRNRGQKINRCIPEARVAC
jgi:hypothetical protein